MMGVNQEVKCETSKGSKVLYNDRKGIKLNKVANCKLKACWIHWKSIFLYKEDLEDGYKLNAKYKVNQKVQT